MGEMASVNPLEAQRKKDKAAAFKRAKMLVGTPYTICSIIILGSGTHP